MKATLTRDQSAELLRRVYALELDEKTYLRELRSLWERLPFGGELSVAFAWSATSSGVIELEAIVAPPSIEATFDQVRTGMSRDLALSMLRQRPVFGAMSEHFPRTRAIRKSADLGFPDFVGILCPTQTGSVVCIGAPQLAARATIRSATLDQLAAHLAAGWRLRKRLSAADAFDESREAVFSPEGRLLDAAGPARNRDLRERLRACVLLREKSIAARDGTIWPALLRGQYTILDAFESSGSRFVVAYRNTPTAARLSRLSDLERDIAKGAAAGVPLTAMAIDLDVTVARVSAILKSALRKLRISNAIDLSLIASSSRFITLDDEILGQHIIRAFDLRGPTSDALLALTPTERAVTADLLRGLSNREIAARRNRSVRTIANQVAAILQKMSAPSRRALAAKLGAGPNAP